MPYSLVNSQSDKGVEKETKTEDENLRQNSNKATNFALFISSILRANIDILVKK